MTSRFNTVLPLPIPLCEIADRLEAAGYPTYFVGGCVRDSLLGVLPGDYDLATAATPDKVMGLLTDCKLIPTGLKHGTVTVIYQGVRGEITTFRKDGSYGDHRRPDSVCFSTDVMEDVSRRDFTVNAMCYSHRRGLLDAYGGISDLKNGVIRCVGDPCTRFEEDALRVLRGLRFAARLGFEIEGNTAKAMLSCAHLVAYISAERVLAELKALFLAPHCCKYIKPFYPVLNSALSVPCHATAEEITKALEGLDAEDRLPAFLAIHSGGMEQARALTKKLKADNATAFTVEAVANAIYGTCLENPISLAYAVRRYGVSNAKTMLAVYRAQGKCLSFNADERLVMMENGVLPIDIKDLAVNGSLLMQNNIAHGVALGDVLEHLYALVHGGMQNSTPVLLAEAEKYMKTYYKQ